MILVIFNHEDIYENEEKVSNITTLLVVLFFHGLCHVIDVTMRTLVIPTLYFKIYIHSKYQNIAL